MKKLILNPENIMAPAGMYSHGFKVKGANLIFLAGQVGIDREGKLVGKGDLKAQARKAFQNLRAVLREGGADMGSVVKFTTFLVDRADVEKFWEVRRELFEEYYPDKDYPPNSLIIVKSLYDEDLLIEIEAIAACD
ncbi:MAG: RidA family protein [Nitrospinota bacterium]